MDLTKTLFQGRRAFVTVVVASCASTLLYLGWYHRHVAPVLPPKQMHERRLKRKLQPNPTRKDTPRMKQMLKRKTILAGFLCLLLLGGATTARAQLFGFMTVFDPSVYGQAIVQVSQLVKQYTQLVQTYEQITNQYNQMLFMAKKVPVVMSQRYSALLTPWRTSTATNTYGTTAGWLNAINSGANAVGGYLQAADRLLTYGPALANVPADQSDRVKRDYATVELRDGASIHAIETIGTLRNNATQVQSTIGALESDSFADNPYMNTEIAVLNKINAATVIALHNSQDTNNVLAALAEHQVAESKQQRDAEARGINNHIDFLAGEQDILAGQKSGTAAAMLSFRMP